MQQVPKKSRFFFEAKYPFIERWVLGARPTSTPDLKSNQLVATQFKMASNIQFGPP
jgi:hypothetical protein